MFLARRSCTSIILLSQTNSLLVMYIGYLMYRLLPRPWRHRGKSGCATDVVGRAFISSLDSLDPEHSDKYMFSPSIQGYFSLCIRRI
ncbi:hypothetical protein Y032_0211g2187 [Ancylostoma ceylanicum]|uniref:Uncharacterized protein n=1 Tax=Ancylostoma ceylanicum TaxID=53326 RepID=A0A016SL17_9BILA|nr:hypothetical protein Y032_0211g2187 [Ancylostoma ceylanicum]